MNEPFMEEIDPDLRNQLHQLREVPEREPGQAAQGRAYYLAMAHRLAAQQRASTRSQQHTTVSETPFVRLKEWIGLIIYPLRRKERFSMVSLLATIAIVLGLVFGGAGATVLAAQDSLPGQPLYTVKTISEDARLELTSNPEARFQLALALSSRRAMEIGALIQAGELVPPQIATRLQSHMQLALSLAAGLDETTVQTEALLELQRHLRDQDRVMGQGRINAPEFTDPVVAQIREQIQNQLQLVEMGLEDPLQFQLRYHQPDLDLPDESDELLATEDPSSLDGGYGPGPGPGPNEQPGEGQLGPMTPPETPPAGDGYGPGPVDCDPQTDCEPAYDGNGMGPNNPGTGNPDPSEPQHNAPSPVPGNSSGTGSKKP